MKKITIFCCVFWFIVAQGQEVIYHETFDDDSIQYTFGKMWERVNKQGKNKWKKTTHDKSKNGMYAKMTAYKTDSIEEDWLILKQDLISYYTAVLRFETAVGYPNHEALSVWLSQPNVKGSAERWEKVEKVQIAQKKDALGKNFSSFIPSGDIDLTAYCGGSVWIGFLYRGNSQQTTLIELDNIVIEAK